LKDLLIGDPPLRLYEASEYCDL